MIKLIIFDFDGVIEDNYEKHYELSSKEFTNLTREEHKQLFDGNIHEELKKLKHRNTGFDVRKYFNEHKVRLITKPKIKECIKKLKTKYLLGIISSAREEGLKKYLENNGLTEYFSFIYGVETNLLKKDKFDLVKRKFQIQNTQIIFVTDTLGDIKEANASDIRTIAVDFGFHDRKRLEKGKPITIVSKFEDIEQAIYNIENEKI